MSGKIVDSEGLPLVGVTVVEEGNEVNGAMTDLDGAFRISVPEGAMLSVSYIGYKTVTVPASAGAMTITLEEDTVGIDDVIVVGYGVQKKANVSGAVATVKMDEVLGDRPAPNAASALQGAVPGLTITTSRTPGQTGNTLQLRGTHTFSGNSGRSVAPLVLIDNVPGSIDAVNPNDIESISVLKDASSSAIYGARAAGGVIIITTKRPQKAEKIQVNYNNNFGFSNAVTTPKQIPMEEFLKMHKELKNGSGYANVGQNIDNWLEYIRLYKTDRAALSQLGTLYDGGVFIENNGDGHRYYLTERDQYKRMLETGFSHNHNVSVTGATDRIRFRVSGNSYDENGPYAGKKDLFNRMTFNGTISADIAKWFTQEADFAYSQRKRNHMVDENGYLLSTRNMNFVPDTVEDPVTGQPYRTPLNIINASNTARTITDVPRFFLKSILRPVKGLEAVFEYTYEKVGQKYDYFSGQYALTTTEESAAARPAHDYMISRYSHTVTNAFNAYLTYKFDVAQDHHFSVMAGYMQEAQNYEWYNTYAEDQGMLDVPSLNGAGGQILPSDEYWDYAIRGGFARINYDYKGKYILELSGRYDGSSKFPKKSRFAFFPSFSVAWNLAEEKFMDSTRDYVNQIKPRFSYGSVGNQNQAGYYGYLSSMTFDAKGTYWLTGDDYAGYLWPDGTLISGNYTWETITTTNVGLDFALFNNRLTGTFEWYQRDTKDILSSGMPMSGMVGASAPLQNVGSLRTRGWELQLNWRGNFAQHKGRYNVGLNLWDYTTVITNINGNEAKTLGYYYNGMRLGDLWGFKWDGFYTVDDYEDLSTWTLKEGVPTVANSSGAAISPKPGDYKYKNLRDGQLNDSERNQINYGKNTADAPGDQTVIGNNLPRYQYGINLGVGYAGFDLSVMLQGVGQRQTFIANEYVYTYPSGYQDAIWTGVFEGTTNYWKPVSTTPGEEGYMVAANPKATLPRIYGNLENGAYNRWVNDHMLQDASYFRIKNITLSYTFPKKWMEKIYVTNLRVFASIENVATFSKLPKGIDPELLTYGYPLYRTVSFGLNLTF
ncbi:MAG: TonB-dependent receptor [Alistipes sp.]|nr:TonB-dependent receptor [Alistipes sp.]